MATKTARKHAPGMKKKTSKRLVRAPKTYIRDSGVLHALLEVESLHGLLGHPVVGASWEGFVIENLLAAARERYVPTFYRTEDGAELRGFGPGN